MTQIKHRNKDGWRRIGKKRKMRFYGDTDYKTKTIRVNKSKKKNKRPGEILDSIVHEESHRLHPKMHEKNIKKHTLKVLKRLSDKMKKKLYSRYT